MKTQNNINEQSLTQDPSAIYAKGPITKFNAQTLTAFLTGWAEDVASWSVTDRLKCLREMYAGYVGSERANDQQERKAVTATFECFFTLAESLSAWPQDEIEEATRIAVEQLNEQPDA